MNVQNVVGGEVREANGIFFPFMMARMKEEQDSPDMRIRCEEVRRLAMMDSSSCKGRKWMRQKGGAR